MSAEKIRNIAYPAQIPPLVPTTLRRQIKRQVLQRKRPYCCTCQANRLLPSSRKIADPRGGRSRLGRSPPVQVDLSPRGLIGQPILAYVPQKAHNCSVVVIPERGVPKL